MDRWKVEAKDPQQFLNWLTSQPEAERVNTNDDLVWLQVMVHMHSLASAWNDMRVRRHLAPDSGPHGQARTHAE